MATTLKILPQINQSDLVRLEIGVEVVKLKDQGDSSGTPTTLKRTANTTVVIHNEETVVIGGIIGQDISTGEYKVPLLGDIPLLGWLFKTHSDYEEKTNLFIFITPHIVENPAELASIYYQKRDVMEYVKEGSSAIPDWKFTYEPTQRHAVALADLGFAKMQQKDYLRARQYYEQALKINPDYPYALLNLGVLNEQDGKPDQAAAAYRRVLELQPAEEAEGAEEANRQLEEIKGRAAENLQHLGGTEPPEQMQPQPVPPPEAPKL